MVLQVGGRVVMMVPTVMTGTGATTTTVVLVGPAIRAVVRRAVRRAVRRTLRWYSSASASLKLIQPGSDVSCASRLIVCFYFTGLFPIAFQL